MDSEAIDLITASPASEPDPDEGVLARAFIAIADDSVVDRALAARLAMRLGCAVVCFTDGSHLTADYCTFIALGGCCSNYADVIICDYDMPGMPGDLAVKKLRKNGFREPIVIVTSTIGVEEECMKAGATQVFLKPITNAMIKGILMIDEGKRSLLLRQPMPRCLSNATTRGTSQHNFILMPPPSNAEKRRNAKEVKALKASTAASADMYQQDVRDLILQVAATQEHLNVEKESHSVLRMEHAELQAAFARLQELETLSLDGSPSTNILSPSETILGDVSSSREASTTRDSASLHHLAHS